MRLLLANGRRNLANFYTIAAAHFSISFQLLREVSTL